MPWYTVSKKDYKTVLMTKQGDPVFFLVGDVFRVAKSANPLNEVEIMKIEDAKVIFTLLFSKERCRELFIGPFWVEESD